MESNFNPKQYFNPLTLAQLSQIANNYNTSWRPSIRFNPQINTSTDLQKLAEQIINARTQGYIPNWDKGLYPMNYGE